MNEVTAIPVWRAAHEFAGDALVVRASDFEALRAENERLKGLLPEMPPRPPDGDGLPRYGLRWNGPAQPLSVPMDDGYWTPWHLADAIVAALRQPVADEREAIKSGVLCDRAYRNGLVAGFGFGINSDETGYQRSLDCYQRKIHEALSAPAAGQDVGELVEALELYSLPLTGDDRVDAAEFGPVAVSREMKRRAALAAHKAGGAKS